MSRIGKSLGINILVTAKGWWRGGTRSVGLKSPGFSSGRMKVFQSSAYVIVAQHRECTKCHRITHLKVVNFVL